MYTVYTNNKWAVGDVWNSENIPEAKLRICQSQLHTYILTYVHLYMCTM